MLNLQFPEKKLKCSNHINFIISYHLKDVRKFWILFKYCSLMGLQDPFLCPDSVMILNFFSVQLLFIPASVHSTTIIFQSYSGIG